MTPEEVDFVKFMLREWKDVYRQHLVLGNTFAIFLKLVPHLEAEMKEHLEKAKDSSQTNALLEKQFQGIDGLVAQFEEGTQEKLTREFLEKFDPEKKPN